MTTREFLVAVSTSGLNDELTTKAQELIAALDAKNLKRKTTLTKEQKEAALRREAVLRFLTERKGETFTRDAIAEALSVTPGQVTAACKSLGDSVTKAEAKVDKAKKVVYSIA